MAFQPINPNYNIIMKEVMLIVELLDPKIDYVFKRIFGHVGNEEITADLLSCIIKRKVTNIELDNNPILEKDLIDDKIGILDIKAKIDNTVNCDIEMQVIEKKNIKKRLLFYWSKLYNMSLKSGQDFDNLEKTIVILIADFELGGLESVKKYLSKWNIREEEYQNIILTDMMEICIIELPKFEKYKEKINNNNLNLWMKFIKNPEVIEMSDTNKAIKQARKVLEEISQDEHERYLAELRQKYIMDQKDIEATGFDKGIKEGIKQGSKSIAKKLKKQNVDIEIISKATGLSIEEIKKLK